MVATAEYYSKILGFTLPGFFADPPVYALVSSGGVEMHFGKADNRPTDQTSVNYRRVGFDAYIWVNDIRALFDELSGSDANIVDGPVKRIYESTEIVVKDCNGFVIVFGD